MSRTTEFLRTSRNPELDANVAASYRTPSKAPINATTRLFLLKNADGPVSTFIKIEELTEVDGNRFARLPGGLVSLE
jgi:hypothetical protein